METRFQPPKTDTQGKPPGDLDEAGLPGDDEADDEPAPVVDLDQQDEAPRKVA